MPYEVTLQGDMRILLRALDPNSVDAVVCDPPYLLGFMGKSWDSTTISYEVETWAECLRVLKPGGYLLAFGATRTYHRIACAIEDAGFEIRDTLQWVFGSGFPKSLDVGKAIDKEAGAVREVVGRGASACPDLARGESCKCAQRLETTRAQSGPVVHTPSTAPATDLARQWHGYGTALKPAHEPITLARKPLSGTVARNVATWGTGGIDVDGCRVEPDDDLSRRPSMVNNTSTPFGKGVAMGGRGHDAGRWPPNIILGDGAAEVIDGMSGVRKFGTAVMSGVKANGSKHAPTSYRVAIETHPLDRHGYEGVGGASEFFPTFCYTPKANRKEREAGLAEAGIEPMTRADVTGRDEESAGQNHGRAGVTARGEIRNTHPTVKPVEIMRWLVRLVSPPRSLNPVILDPFMGSGTTGIACVQEGVSFIGIELDERNYAISEARISHARKTQDQAQEKPARRNTRT